MAQGTKLTPYIFFGGNCREAMEFYKSVFGGELTFSTYADGPPDAHSDPKANSEEMKSKIMFSKLEGDIVVLASDSPYRDADAKIDSFSLSLEGSDNEKLTGYFNQLSQGGTINSPLTKQFWGDTFGMVVDQFGIHWMVSISGGNTSE